MRKLFGFIFLMGLGLSAAIIFFTVRCFAPTTQDSQELAYYRAVYVLQQLDSRAAAEKIVIPPYVKRHDSTESYLHHQDKRFVLRSLLTDLAGASRRYPEAPLFRAYGHLTLGEHAEAASLLNHYVAEAAYSERQYEALCESLRGTDDYTQLYLAVQEWRERDAECSQQRILCTWYALFSLGRYADAQTFMQTEGVCLGWTAGVYAARAALEAGGNYEALIADTMKRYPKESVKIDVLWSRLKNQQVF